MPSDVGIVGFGRCGRLAAGILSRDRRVVVTDVRDLSDAAAALGVAWGSLEEVADRAVVLLAAPIRALPGILDTVAPRLRPDGLVVDLASVKSRPMEWMAETLPRGVARVGTHPLFGPDSVREQGIEGQRIVVVPAEGHAEAADRVTRAARAIGLEPIVTTAEDHDRQMARSQALVFLVARAVRGAGLGTTELGTPTERRVGSALRLVDDDTLELYEDILRLNPWAAEAAGALRDAIGAEVEHLFG